MTPTESVCTARIGCPCRSPSPPTGWFWLLSAPCGLDQLRFKKRRQFADL
jgi:hypothetical protein